MPTFPDPNSIVDFLKTEGVDSSFQNRGQIFEQLGFGAKDQFQGTAEQNTNVLNTLRNDPNALGSLKGTLASQPTTTPTVVTSDKARETTQQNIQNLQEDLAFEPKQQETNFSDFIEDEAPTDLSPEEAELRSINASLEAQTNADITALENLRTTTGSANNTMIEGLKADLARRLTEMRDLNTRVLEGQRLLGITSGRSRYAPVVEQGILSDEERKGLERLGQIESEGKALIAQAEQAARAEDFELLQEISGKRTLVLQEKAEILRDQVKLQQEEDAKRREQTRQLNKELAVAKIIKEGGITDPIDVLRAGRAAGIKDLSLKEVTQVTDEIVTNEAENKSIRDIMIEIAPFASPDTMDQIQAALQSGSPDRLNKVLQLAGEHLNTADTQLTKLDNGNTVLIDKRTGDIVKNIGGAKITSGEFDEDAPEAVKAFSSLIDTAANLEKTVSGKEAVREQLRGLIERSEYKSAYNQIANTVEDSLTGETKNRFANARIDIEVMNRFRDALAEYQARGGDMGLLKGKSETIRRKLGSVKDPEFTELAVALEREFQTYRNIMTGAAFTPAESAEYAAVNPTSSKSIDLNLATIDGALRQLGGRVQGTINAKVPQAKDLIKMTEVTDDELAAMEADLIESGISPATQTINDLIK